MKSTQFLGMVRAYASENNPLQTIIEFVLTDFEPNKNKMRIPETEAENVINSARNMPIKVNYTNEKIRGHAFSVPIGTIADVWLEDNAVKARSVIWKAEYPHIDEYLRTATSEGKSVGTSWEILYENGVEKDGITNLFGCIVQATTIVDNPAYGERTRILSIAESLDLMDELETLRSQLSDLVYVIDTFYAEQMQKEYEQTALENAQAAFDKIKELFSKINTSKAEVEAERDELKVSLEDKISALQNRVVELEAEKAEAEKQKAEAELLETRSALLKDVGVVLSAEDLQARKTFYLAMSEEQFTTYRDDLVRATRSKIDLPDTLSSGSLSPKDIAKALKEGKK